LPAIAGSIARPRPDFAADTAPSTLLL
jgi:hypothetical protein